MMLPEVLGVLDGMAMLLEVSTPGAALACPTITGTLLGPTYCVVYTPVAFQLGNAAVYIPVVEAKL